MKEEMFLLTRESIMVEDRGALKLRKECSYRYSKRKMERIHHRNQCQPALPSLKRLSACLLQWSRGWELSSGF